MVASRPIGFKSQPLGSAIMADITAKIGALSLGTTCNAEYHTQRKKMEAK